MIEQLRAFHRIGWDFDGTLHRHPKSWMMHAFIRENPQIEHHIVTFRSHGWQNRVFDELADSYPTPPVREEFTSVINIADDAFAAWNAAVDARRSGTLAGDLIAAEIFYHNWKGEVCKHHGIAVLVDDDTPRVFMGCESHGIMHIHPDML